MNLYIMQAFILPNCSVEICFPVVLSAFQGRRVLSHMNLQQPPVSLLSLPPSLAPKNQTWNQTKQNQPPTPFFLPSSLLLSYGPNLKPPSLPPSSLRISSPHLSVYPLRKNLTWNSTQPLATWARPQGLHQYKIFHQAEWIRGRIRRQN